MSAIKDAVTTVKEKEAELLKILSEAVSPVLDAIAATGEADMIYIYGYTPGFNDGDPCEHGATVLVNLEEVFYEEKTEEYFLKNEFGMESEEIAELLEGLDNIPYVSRYSDGVTDEDIAEHAAKKKVFHDALSKEIGIRWDKPTDADITTAIETIVVPALDREFGTNYQVLYRLKDGKFVRTHSEYECGW